MKWILSFMRQAMDCVYNAKEYAIAEYVTDPDNKLYSDEFAEAIVKANKDYAKDLKDYLEQELKK